MLPPAGDILKCPLLVCSCLPQGTLWSPPECHKGTGTPRTATLLAPSPEAGRPSMGLQGFVWPCPHFSWAGVVLGFPGVIPGGESTGGSCSTLWLCTRGPRPPPAPQLWLPGHLNPPGTAQQPAGRPLSADSGAAREPGSEAAVPVPPRGRQSGPGVLPASPCLFICSCVSRGRGEAQAERSSAGEKGAVGSPRFGSDRRRVVHPAPARTASCAALSPGDRSGEERRHGATSALPLLPEQPLLPQPCL